MGVEADDEALEHSLRLIDGYEFSVARTAEFATDLELRSRLEGLIHVASAGLVVIGTVRLVRRAARREEGSRAGVLLLAWFFTPVAMMTVHPFPVHPHYLLIGLPAGFLILANGLVYLARRPSATLVAAGVTVVFVVLSGLNLLRFFQVIEETPDIGRLEWLPLRYSAPMGQAIEELSKDWGLQEVYSEMSEPLLVALSGTTLESYQDFDPDTFVVLPADRPALYVIASSEVGPSFGFAEREWELMLPGPRRGVSLFLFPPRSPSELAGLPSNRLDVAFEIGFRLLGYDLPHEAAAGEGLRIATYFQVETLRADLLSSYYGPFYHLIDAEGNQLMVSSGGGAPGHQWREGDVYLSSGTMILPEDLPPGDYWIHTGLFDPNANRRAAISDPQTPLAELGVVPLGPIRVVSK